VNGPSVTSLPTDRASHWGDSSELSWCLGQSRRNLLLVCRYRAGVVRKDAPVRLAVQCSSNPATYLGLVFRGRNENRPELSAVDLIVMWPAARALMFPMAAECDRHPGADCRRIGALGQHDLRLMDICLRVHGGNVQCGSLAEVLAKCFGVRQEVSVPPCRSARVTTRFLVLASGIRLGLHEIISALDRPCRSLHVRYARTRAAVARR
jgi:hypothetical protein